ncbi:MAG: hypothetical protein JJLCMIEE_01683 [Acidimicrobiales bacterium]|nr:hypothetical protein [Acidimicrobiales bacterium]
MGRTQLERKADTRERLVRAAAELFGSLGFHSVSTDAVAARADRTSGAVYAHFGSKQGLLLAVLEEWRSETAADAEVELDAATDLDARTEALWRTLSSRTGERGDAWLMLEMELWLHAARQPELRQLLAERYDEIRHEMAHAFEEWAATAGSSLASPPDEMSTLVLALLLGLGLQRRMEPESVSDELAGRGIRSLLGLGAG